MTALEEVRAALRLAPNVDDVLTWLEQHPSSTATQIASGVCLGRQDTMYVLSLLRRAESGGLVSAPPRGRDCRARIWTIKSAS